MSAVRSEDAEQQAVDNLYESYPLERARRDASWHMSLELKTPEEFATTLPRKVILALKRIYHNGQHGWQARADDAELQRSYGLVEARGRGVGAYAIKVYRAMVELDRP